MKEKLHNLMTAALLAVVILAIIAGIAALAIWYQHYQTWYTNVILFVVVTAGIYREVFCSFDKNETSIDYEARSDIR